MGFRKTSADKSINYPDNEYKNPVKNDKGCGSPRPAALASSSSPDNCYFTPGPPLCAIFGAAGAAAGPAILLSPA
jgi:hypothetical protein